MKDFKLQFAQALQKCDGRSLIVLYGHIVSRLSFKELGERFDCSKETARRYMQMSLNSIRKSFGIKPKSDHLNLLCNPANDRQSGALLPKEPHLYRQLMMHLLFAARH